MICKNLGGKMEIISHIIDDTTREKAEVTFIVDKNNFISPKSKQDEDILINFWNINDEILKEFINFINQTINNNEEKISLLTDTKKYIFVDREEIYDLAVNNLDINATQDEIDDEIDEIVENAIFGYESAILIKKQDLEKR